MVPPPTGATVVRTSRTITGTAVEDVPLNDTPNSLHVYRRVDPVFATSRVTSAVAAPRLIASDAAKYWSPMGCSSHRNDARRTAWDWTDNRLGAVAAAAASTSTAMAPHQSLVMA